MTTFEAEWTTRSPEETRELARDLGRRLSGGRVIGLSGPLGAGKTLFVKGFAEGLGVLEPGEVKSPTFVLQMEHPRAGGGLLVHLDAYRLSGDLEFLDLGVDDHLTPENVVMVEWYDRVVGALPNDIVHITLEPQGENVRRIRVHGAEGSFFADPGEPASGGPVGRRNDAPE